VLVPLPLEADAAAELASKAVAALGDDADMTVWLKPHPMSGRAALERALRLGELPPTFEIVSGHMADWLGRAGVVVALASATVVESLAAGVPVVNVGRETSLDLNPLGWHPGLAEVVSGPREIRTRVVDVLNRPDGALAARRAVALAGFGKVTDDTMAAFLEAARG
jgi:uncharacterized membrane protein (DUF4010 family)